MRKILLFLLILTGILSAQTWQDATRQYRLLITADSAQIYGTDPMTAKPILFNLEKLRGEGIFPHFNTNGDDIRVYRKGKSGKLDIELVSFSKTDSTGQIFFKTDSLSKNVREFYLYYGNSGVNPESSSYDVWDSYGLVMHFEEESAYRVSNSASITATAGVDRTSGDRVAGVNGYAADFDYAIADSIGLSPSIQIGYNDFVLTALTNIKSTVSSASYAYYLTNGATGITDEGYYFGYYYPTNKLNSTISNGTARESRFSTATVGRDAWHHIGWAMYRSAQKKWWIDGTVDLGTIATFYPSDDVQSNNSTTIGYQIGLSTGIEGQLDELRLYVGQLTDEWIATENKNLTSSTFWTIGSEENVLTRRNNLASGWYSSIIKKVPPPPVGFQVVNYNLEEADISKWKIINTSQAVVSYARNTTSPIAGLADYRLQVTTANPTTTAHPALYAFLTENMQNGHSYKISLKYKVNSGDARIAAVQFGAGYISQNLILSGTDSLSWTTTCNRTDYQAGALYLFFRGDYVFDVQIDEWVIEELTVTTPVLIAQSAADITLTIDGGGETPVNYGYEIYRSTDGINFDNIIGTTARTYVDNTAASNVTYYYYVITSYLTPPSTVSYSLPSNIVSAFKISGSGVNYVSLYNVNPTKFEPLTGTNLPAGATILDTLRFNATPGEYEPGSFILKTTVALTDVRLEISNLTSGLNSIPGTAIDPYIAKVWWQAGINTIFNDDGEDALVQELLIRQDTLIKVNYSSISNQLLVKNKSTGVFSYTDISSRIATFPTNVEINDATTLQPFKVGTDRYKQLYFIVKVPTGTPAGWYKGTITLRNGSTLLKTVPIRVRVYPFTLQEPVILYGCYYSAGVVASISDSYAFSGLLKDTIQYRIEMQDLKNHGILYPMYNNNEYSVNLSMSIRDKAGLPKDKVFIHTFGQTTVDAATGSITMQSAIDRANRFKNAFSSYGIPLSSLYFYGWDEANTSRYGLPTGELTSLEKAVQVYSALKSAISGIKMFQAISSYGTNFTVASPYLDLPILYANRESVNYPYVSGTYAILPELAKWKNIGKPVYAYNNPQYGYENPEIYRKNQGLFLWRDGFTGEMGWKYQSTQGHTWNDWDDYVAGRAANYRDPNLTYPITRGVLSTVQWEGVREAVDDNRYLNTLIVNTNLLPSSSFKTEQLNYINSLKSLNYDTTGAAQLDAIRAEIARRIILVKQQLGQL
jgi:hypothetical protein